MWILMVIVWYGTEGQPVNPRSIAISSTEFSGEKTCEAAREELMKLPDHHILTLCAKK